MRRRTAARFSLVLLSCFRAVSATLIYFLYFVVCDGVRHLGERLVGEAGVGQPVWLPLSLGGGNGLMIWPAARSTELWTHCSPWWHFSC